MSANTEQPREISDRDRLSTLADSVNDAARMARFNISTMLLVAFYVAIMILLATDENLFRNATVTLPYFSVGISLKQSYLVAPLALVWLHFQTLLLLAVLTRKVDVFEAALEKAHDKSALRREEYRSWLSATNFVQSVQSNGGISLFAKIMSWISVAVIPLVLLFLVDMSFLKYQSAWMTGFHNTLFCVDFLSVGMFSIHFFGRLRQNTRNEKRREMKVAVNITILIAVLLGGLVWKYAWPTAYGEENDTMCWKQWRVFCRNLNLEGAVLVGPEHFLDLADFMTLDAQEIGQFRRLRKVNVKKRSLRFANLKNSYLYGIDLGKANLQEAKLEGAELIVVSLQRAEMQGAVLKNAKLSIVDLTGAISYGVNLEGATFHHGWLDGINLTDAELKNAKLSSTTLNGAILQGATLENARLLGADLSEDDLSGASLKGALLLGTRLSQTKAHGTSLEGAIGAGMEEMPDLDGQGDIASVMSKIAQLPGLDCTEEGIRSFLDAMGVKSGITLAWKPDIALVDYLLETDCRDVTTDWIENDQ